MINNKNKIMGRIKSFFDFLFSRLASFFDKGCIFLFL